MSQRAIFLDKDGTVIVNVPYNADPNLIELMPGAGEALCKLRRAGYRLIMISNQAGVAHGHFPESALALVHARVNELLQAHGVQLDGFYYCPHHPAGSVPQYRCSCNCRKPMPGMIQRAASDHAIDLSESWFLGDILDDMEAGKRAGCQTILVDAGSETEWQLNAERAPDHHAYSMLDAVAFILARSHWPIVCAAIPQASA